VNFISNGDRKAGVGYSFINYADTSMTGVALGDWTAATSFVYNDGQSWDMSATGVHKDLEKLLIKAEELVGKMVIGTGAYGEVYKSDHRGTAVAVKTMKQVGEESLERFQDEIMLMSGLRHQNVVTMLGCCWEKDLMALVMEFCEKGTSTEVLKAQGDHLSWDDPLLKWLLDVSRGMNYLHGMTYYDADKKEQVRGIIHRDLMPDNCLVTKTWGVKIADFGEARAALEDATMTQVGTPIYISPEVVKGEHYTGQADVFSFAMTILQLGLRSCRSSLSYGHKGDR